MELKLKLPILPNFVQLETAGDVGTLSYGLKDIPEDELADWCDRWKAAVMQKRTAALQRGE